MGLKFKYLIGFALIISLASCATSVKVPSATSSGPRTIILEGETISEDSVGGFTSWYCKDFIHEGPVLVEVGFFNDVPDLQELGFGMQEIGVDLQGFRVGFILYDGGYSGDVALYRRMGLEHRWDWGPNKNFAFVIKSDGTGFYYDFTAIPEDEKVQASEVYKCYKRKVETNKKRPIL